MRVLLVLLLTFLPASMSAQTGSLDLLPGTWVNEHETRGITRVSVRKDGVRMIVHAWGSCVPIDCDWGETDVDLWKGLPAAIWKHGFATSKMQIIPLPDGRIIIADEAEFNDGSERKDNGQAEFFRRLEVKSDSNDAALARVVLRQTAETYRNLPAAYFEAVSTATRRTAKTEVRTITREKIFSAPPNKIRVEFDGSGESSLLIDDGASEWTVYPIANEYKTRPQAQGPIPDGPLSGYTLLDSIRGDPKIVGSGDVQNISCSVVRIVMDHGVTEELWIDESTHSVRKDIFDEGTSKKEIVFTVARLGVAATPENFAYDPATTNAKNRTDLAQAASATLVGKPAPDFSLRDLDGRTVDLRTLRGKPVLLDFWATWCGYCREALPSVELLHRGLQDKLAVFGIDNEEPELAREYLQKYGYTLPTLVDTKDEAVNLYHLNGWPTTVLIDRDGRVAFYAEGFESEKLRDALRAIGIW
jgi:cytochrome c biogenesis protein CcmG/thiol:disulfide interchange protein DsbE